MMSGFKDKTYNIEFKQNLFNNIILHIYSCCKAMRDECQKTGNFLPKNSEDKISNRLVARYLNFGIKGIRFTRENLEGFDSETDTFKGRSDIRVILTDYLNRDYNDDAYYTVEAKRLDGDSHLNNKYVSDGISRFVRNPPHYTSHYEKNIMLGYVVQAIDISENTDKIDKRQRKKLTGINISDMVLICDNVDGFSNYQCSYRTDGTEIELTHLFCDFSSVVK